MGFNLAFKGLRKTGDIASLPHAVMARVGEN
jgi:hypothetical protein